MTMQFTSPRHFLCWATILSLSFTGFVNAEETQHNSVAGLDIYYGILPAEMVYDAEMEHGGSKSDKNAYHLVIALFSAKTRNRITDAEVEARVEPLGLMGETKKLEPMMINQTVTFGNYFQMPDSGPYRITVRIRLPHTEDWIETTFVYQHS